MSHAAAGGDQDVSRQFRLPHISAGAIVAALLVLQFALLVTSMLDESPVTDEPNHLTRGLAWFWGPDTTLSWAHPPLGNVIAALPVVLSSDRVEMGNFRSYRGGDVYSVAKDLLDKKYDQRRGWFFEGRVMIALLSVGLAFYVYRLGKRLFGVAVGLCALGFFVLHPTLLAHGRLVTTDMPVTVAMTIAVGELITFLNGGARWHGAAAALGASAAIVTKYTGLALVPLATLAVFCVMALRAGRYRAMPRSKALLAASTFVVLSASL
ncbi:MAG TPA: glycosyltransferase family 39 protein, partial [Polyangiaceae bacterium]|nr:glycosyltransferase family 39 protein [Polyangiaceae bacterium]